MRSYWIRSSMIIIIFINLIIISIATWFAYRGFIETSIPIIYLLWAAYFFILLMLVVSHKKHTMKKAMLNIMFLTLIAIPILTVSLPINFIVRGFSFYALKDQAYMLISLLMVLYLIIRHEQFTIKDAKTRLTSYVREISTLKLKSSFGRYLIFELISFILIVVIAHSYLK